MSKQVKHTEEQYQKLVEALKEIRDFADNESFMNVEDRQIITAKCWLALSQLEKDGE
jgi:hypothetical protein